MKLFKFVLTAVAMTATAMTADAVIAYPGVMTMKCADGSTIRIVKHGDEALHFTTTEDGLLLHEADGVFTYARIDAQGTVTSTGVVAHDAAVRTASEAKVATRIEALDIPAIEKRRNTARRRAESYQPFGSTLKNSGLQSKNPGNAPSTLTLNQTGPATPINPATRPQRAPQSGVGMKASTYPTTGSPKGLIVLVQYKDVKFTHPDPAQYFGDMINKHGFSEYGASGSALDYFTEQSDGQFTPRFDVLGPVTLSKNMKAYGGNDSNGDDVDARGMVVEACQMLDPTTDFSVYDTDGDGEIDNVFVFYAGLSEAAGGSANCIWPHSWDVRGAYNVSLDGKILGHYACSNEWQYYYNKPDGIGTFCHEFSHVMGLPDLYCTSGASIDCTPGKYSLMDQGSYNNTSMTPPNYSAYEKNALRWFEPFVFDDGETVTLDPVSSGQFGLIPTTRRTEFYLLENRQQTGWDSYIPGHGLLIWHIDYDEVTFDYNEVNNDADHQRVDIVEANNSPWSSAADGWTFPGTTGKTAFTSSTSPALKTWAGTAIDLPVTDITENTDRTVSFNIAGGGKRLITPEPMVDEIGNDDLHFVARWPHVDGATDYLVTVYANHEDNIIIDKADFNNRELPEGWTNTASSNSFANAEGSTDYAFALVSDNQALYSATYAGDVTNISFNLQGITNSAGRISSNLDVFYIKEDGSYSGIYFPISDQKYYIATINASQIPEGTRRIAFQLDQTYGYIALDNIQITSRRPDEIVPQYNRASTGGKNELRIDNLPLGHPKYYFTVQAVNDSQTSRTSDPFHVFLLGQTGVDNITTDSPAADGPVRYFNLQGLEVANPTPGNIYIRLQNGRASKVLVR